MSGWQCIDRLLPLRQAALMGVVNVTPDSFSDGGAYADVDDAVSRALEMLEHGAAIVDIGGESTRPGAEPVTVEQEWRRIGPVIEGLTQRSDALISVDTTKVEVARRALAAGARIINDISGATREPEMLDLAAETGAGLALMHMRGTPATMRSLCKYDDVVAQVHDELAECVARARGRGVAREQIVIDPGLGFAKDAMGSLRLLRNLASLTSLGYPILIGPSRKSFLGVVLGEPDPLRRTWGTAAAVALGITLGAKVLRVHDVEAMRQVALVTQAILVGEITPPGGEAV